MLVSPLIRNMSTHFLLLLRECVVTASELQDDREGIGPGRPDSTIAPGEPGEFTFTCNGGAQGKCARFAYHL
jgi:hypothetical protein